MLLCKFAQYIVIKVFSYCVTLHNKSWYFSILCEVIITDFLIIVQICSIIYWYLEIGMKFEWSQGYKNVNIRVEFEVERK